MILKELKLKNFGTIEKFNYNFKNPLTILSGNNGQGKSTVIKAILLALFDNYNGKLEDYIKWGKDYFTIELKFEHKAVDYDLDIKYDGATTRVLSFNDTTLKGDEVKKHLKDTLDITLLKAAMVVSEQQVDIVDTKPSERRDYLKLIYDLDFKRQIADINLESNQEKEHSIKLEAQIETLSNIVDTELIKPKAPFTQQEHEQFNSELLNAQSELAKIKEQIKYSSNLTHEIQELETKLVLIRNDYYDYKKGLEEIESKKSQLAEDKEAEQKRLNSSINLKNTRIEEIESTAKGDIEKIQEEIKVAKERIGELYSVDALQNLTSIEFETKGKIRTIKEAKDVCPMCGTKLISVEHKEKQALELKQLENLLSTTQEQIILAKEKETKISENLNRETKIEQLGYTFRQEVKLIKEQITSLNNSLAAIDETYENKEKVLDTKKEALVDKIKSSETNIKNLEEEIVTKKASIIMIDDTRYEELETLIAKRQENIKEYTHYLVQLDNYVVQKEKQELAKQEREKDIKNKRTELATVLSDIADLKEQATILRTQFPVFVISKITQDIENKMNDFLAKTYDNRYTVSVVDKRNALHIVYGDKDQDVALASGYEKALFNLAFKIAISKTIGNKTLILDEADATASLENSKLFYQVLAASIGTDFNQVILVSHKGEIRNLLEYDHKAQSITFTEGVPEYA